MAKNQIKPHKLEMPDGSCHMVESAEFSVMVVDPVNQATVTLEAYNKSWGDLDLAGLIMALEKQVRAVQSNDLSGCEAMLVTQAHTLDAIYNHLAKLAVNATEIKRIDMLLKSALRSQSQCRATLTTISDMKRPTVVYTNQTNIASGPQQVNNVMQSKDSPMQDAYVDGVEHTQSIE